MPTKMTVYDLLISCPSDVSEFIPEIEKTVYRFNSVYGKELQMMVRPIYWSNSTYPELGGHPQELINKQIVNDTDFIISIFWSRFGQPTLYYDSGTEEEIETMLNAHKQVFLYFLDKPLPPSHMDYSQYQKLQSFKEAHKTEGLYFTVPDEKALCEMFYDHLKLYFNRIHYGKQIKSNGQKKCILWVDDRPENNVFERKILEGYDIEVLIALSTQQGLSYLSSNDAISLIISDMGRKEGPAEGYVLLDAVRKVNSAIPFFIFAGSKSPEHIKEAHRRGAQGCTNNSYELIDYVIKSLLK